MGAGFTFNIFIRDKLWQIVLALRWRRDDVDAFVSLVMAERIRTRDSNTCVSDQQSVGLSPVRRTCVLKHYCFILQMGQKASTLIAKGRGSPECS